MLRLAAPQPEELLKPQEGREPLLELEQGFAAVADWLFFLFPLPISLFSLPYSKSLPPWATVLSFVCNEPCQNL